MYKKLIVKIYSKYYKLATTPMETHTPHAIHLFEGLLYPFMGHFDPVTCTSDEAHDTISSVLGLIRDITYALKSNPRKLKWKVGSTEDLEYSARVEVYFTGNNLVVETHCRSSSSSSSSSLTKSIHSAIMSSFDTKKWCLKPDE